MKTYCIIFSVLLFGLWPGRLVANEINLGAPTSHTPYDQYLAPMWRVFGQLSEGQPDRPTVEKLVSRGRSFRYIYRKEQPYVPQTPEETEAKHAGDCKAKSLWLASRMNTRKLRLVIGKAKAGDAMSHAWLLWNGPDGWLVLDATFYSRPLVPERLSPKQLVPTYSYSPGGKYAHTVRAADQGARYGDHL